MTQRFTQQNTQLAAAAVEDFKESPARPAREPIALVGIGCRFPGGVRDPEAFWRMLRDGVDAISEVPADRFDIEAFYDPRPATPGKVMSRWGGFLDKIDQFDAAFFGISPREADRLDPQQRLLLETAYEALEDAGLPLEQLEGSPTGVFVGMWLNDYEARMFADPTQTDFYMTIGSGRYSASGRISYTFGLQGPSLTLDSACSSSLVAVHLACQSIWNGECGLALAGGANVILQPHITIAYSQSRMMAPDGQCKFGDARANGYVRSEGAAVVALKPLAQALADGDPVYAVIRGSAVTNDGRSSGFLATPGQAGQEEMLRNAYRAAGIAPTQVQYVEAHGTGTNAGDPVEIGALGTVLGAGRSAENPLIIGSVKTNFGHTEGAAGLAGLIKVALALKHGQIPPTLHFETPNPAIPWQELNVAVRPELLPWPQAEYPAIGGVSSFGIAGTNAHVVLQAAPVAAPTTVRETKAFLLPLSARSPEALVEIARNYRALITEQRSSLADLCYTAGARRAHHEQRVAFAVRNPEELLDQLDAFVQGKTPASVSVGNAADLPSPAGVVFVFPGQGSQWLHMGQQLLQTELAFRAAIERCDAAIRAEAGWSLLAELAADAQHSRLAEIDVVQPALFAMEVALAALWRAWGIEPAAVVGHSMGEVAAAHVAGILTLEDATRVICRRSRLLRRVSGQGAMAVVELSRERAQLALKGYETQLSIAVSNSPTSTVLSGDPAALDSLLGKLQAQNIFCRRVKVDVASHSPQMDPLRDELRAALADLRPQAAYIPFFSTVTSQIEDGTQCNADYWVRNLRQPVLFANAVQQFIADDKRIFVEMSPHPVLLPAIESTLSHAGQRGATVPSLLRNANEPLTMLGSLGALYTAGYAVDWQRAHPDGGNIVRLPTYPWQQKRFWFDQRLAQRTLDAQQHPILGRTLAGLAHLPGSRFWERTFDGDEAHQLAVELRPEVSILPTALYTQLALAASAEIWPESHRIEQLDIHDVVTLGEHDTPALQTIVTPLDASKATIHIFGRTRENEPWFSCATSTLVNTSPAQAEPAPPTLQTIQDRCSRGDSSPQLNGVDELWYGNNEALGRLAQPDSSADDNTLQLLETGITLLATAYSPEAEKQNFVPIGAEYVHMHGSLDVCAWMYARVDQTDTTGFRGDVGLLDQAGRLLVELKGVRWAAPRGALQERITQAQLHSWLYTLDWQPQPRTPNDAPFSPGRWLIFADHHGTGATLATLLAERGEECVLVFAGDSFGKTAAGNYTLDPTQPDDVRQLLNEMRAGDGLPWRAAVHLWSLDAAALDADSKPIQAQALISGSALYLAQALVHTALPGTPRLWLATRGAQSVTRDDAAPAVAQAPLWGLGRVIAVEHPELWGGLIDLDPADTTTADALLAEISQPDGEDQVALRGTQRYAARLERYHAAPSAPLVVRADASYLVTGGLGGLGLKIAQWLVERGARHLALVGRSEPNGAARAAVRELEAAGAQVLLVRGDIAQREQVVRVLAEIDAALPPLRGVIHAAGILDDHSLLRQDWNAFARVMAPKVAGAWNLHTLTQDRPLDLFVLFSSVMALIGAPGQANYAAANAFLDALAHERRAHGLAALSVNWGVWGNVGMVAQANRDQLTARRGLRAMPPEQGVAALEYLLRQNATQAAAMPIDWATFLAQQPSDRTPSLFADIARTFADNSTAAPAATHASDILRQCAAAAPAERAVLMQQYVSGVIAAVMRFDATRPIGLQQGFFQLGMDSLMSMELRNRLQADLNQVLPPTVAFDYPTIIKLAQFLLECVAPAPEPAQPSAPPELQNQLIAELAGLDQDELRLLLDAELQSIDEELFG